ncbi:CSN-associated deubiquitinating enzyme Ubp12 [Pichia californica]|uniref:ubiquitinyl hydrolase 1 n=1 Tax=Pichia californica TaxID=460514 RepID=A0A9P6WKZ6_9ASCO|nr:CSN-associated deubiquitinating enzyme Ubp12 [[Candida] californica]
MMNNNFQPTEMDNKSGNDLKDSEIMNDENQKDEKKEELKNINNMDEEDINTKDGELSNSLSSSLTCDTGYLETEGYVTASETPDENNCDGIENVRSIDNTENKVDSLLTFPEKSIVENSIVLSPKTTDSSSCLSSSSSKNEGSIINDTKEEKKPLILPQMAIVNEFNKDFFETCFCSNSETENYGGQETWSNPRILANDELERERQLTLEKSKKPVTLYDCLDLFSKPETLSQNDLWYCPQCKEHRQATKKIELWSAPDILTIHLKRFESTQSFSDKIDITVDFPIEGLDLTKYVADKDGDHIYDLFAVDNHYGGLGGGHYTAYVKNFIDNKWYYFNDSRVTSVSDPKESIKGSAYLLFYRKRSDVPLGGEYIQKITNEIQKQCDELKKKLDEYQVEQVSHTSSISETSDEEMHVSETSMSPVSFQPENELEQEQEQHGIDLINTRKGDTVNGITDEYTDTDMDIDDGNKRRKLGQSSSNDESILNSTDTIGNGTNSESIEEE